MDANFGLMESKQIIPEDLYNWSVCNFFKQSKLRIYPSSDFPFIPSLSLHVLLENRFPFFFYSQKINSHILQNLVVFIVLP